jgi:hypothetical protein
MNKITIHIEQLRGIDTRKMDLGYYDDFFELYLNLCLQMNQIRILYPLVREG